MVNVRSLENNPGGRKNGESPLDRYILNKLAASIDMSFVCTFPWKVEAFMAASLERNQNMSTVIAVLWGEVLSLHDLIRDGHN